MRRSPLQLNNMSPETKKLAIELRMMKRLNEVYEAIDEHVLKAQEIFEEANKAYARVEAHAQRITNLPKGEKGDSPTKAELRALIQPLIPEPVHGKDGYTPVKGKDYFDGKDGVAPSINAIVATVLSQIKSPKDGKDAVINIEEIATRVIEELKDENKFNWKKIPGLENEISSYRNQLAGKRYGKETWARGGGTTVSAGANITLTPQADGTVQIAASGGGSGTNVTTQYQVTAVQAGANVTIDLSQLTNFATYQGLVQLQRNNIPQTETLNFTQTPTEITVLEADASEIFNIVYQYA